MYSLILMTTMSAAPQGPEFNGYFRDLFTRGGGCAGTSCQGWVPGSRIRALFAPGGCTGCYGSCAGRAAGCFGTAYSCHGCTGASFACSGGMATAPADFGTPTYPAPGFDPAPFGGPYLPGAVPPVRGPGTDGVPFAPNMPAPPAVIDDRNAYRASPSPARATVVVKLPTDAKLYAEGRLLQLTSGERTFVTPELPGGKEYAYTFKVEYDRGGETVSQAKRVTVRPGATTPIAFTDLVLAKAPAEPAPKATANTTATTPAAAPAPGKEADKPNPFKVPAGTGGPAAAERARITVKLPPGATLYIDDQKKDGAAAVREFTTPPLPPGKEFAYLMKVEVVRNGLPEHLTEKVVFRAGETVTRDFAAVFPVGQRAGR